MGAELSKDIVDPRREKEVVTAAVLKYMESVSPEQREEFKQFARHVATHRPREGLQDVKQFLEDRGYDAMTGIKRPRNAPGSRRRRPR
jgi:hypothetical protein